MPTKTGASPKRKSWASPAAASPAPIFYSAPRVLGTPWLPIVAVKVSEPVRENAIGGSLTWILLT
jgi:hypothetical protein